MFIPRSIKRKQPDTIFEQPINKKQLTKDVLSNGSSSDDVDDTDDNGNDGSTNTNFNPNTGNNSQAGESVKQLSSQQRLVDTNSDEPSCIICGKYGEYINDETENDVCSMECKKIDTDMSHHPKLSIAAKLEQQVQQSRTDHDTTTQTSTLTQHFTAENVHAKWTNYQESESVYTMTRAQRDAILKAHDLVVRGGRLPRPITSYDQCYTTLGDTLYNNLETNLGWHMATSIQRMAVPVGLAGRDLYVSAPTHSGKTGAFLIPLVVHCQSLNAIHRYKRRGGPYALIIAPTRELCQQIENITKQMVQNIRNLRTALLVGGQPLATQLHRLKTGVQIVIGTPGRILDIAKHHPALLRLFMVRMVVLDEADAIFGLGFEHQVKEIMARLSNNAVLQTSLFSATMDGYSEKDKGDSIMKRKMQDFLNAPVEISIRSVDDDDGNDNQSWEVGTNGNDNSGGDLVAATSSVRQTVLWVENNRKAKRLLSILSDPKYFMPPTLVFVDSRLGAEFLTRAIQKQNGALRVVAMHADKDQDERAKIVAGINDQQGTAWDVVVSTNILARGIDLPCVRLVINYDMTTTLEEYIHRIGRAVIHGPLTRNAKERRGWAITFVNKENQNILPAFTKMLSRKALHQVTPLPSQMKKYL
ncbi:P-loop containing nucleoside triphosphate hydrolase protein [Absidia repens]|uniref:RNA helicase n=1 Tax=Absidia repens TaxID=90262 RepID=A0A1X2ITY0_9FUNG|nr:P-loop containing nucleoside triphosphate hydrolase protein [Absidia repens]